MERKPLASSRRQTATVPTNREGITEIQMGCKEVTGIYEE